MKRYGAAVAGGLLASSCCVVQLVLNLFSIGCAGFNTALGPYRPVFLLLALGGLAYSFYADVLLPQPIEGAKKTRNTGKAPSSRRAADCAQECVHERRKKRFAITAAIVLLLSISPEILAAINAHPDLLLAPIQRHLNDVVPPQATSAAAPTPDCDWAGGATKISVHVEGMHCAACQTNAINALVRLDRDCARVQLAYETGQGHIVVPAGRAAAITDQRIEQAIADVKFSARVLCREPIAAAAPVAVDL